MFFPDPIELFGVSTTDILKITKEDLLYSLEFFDYFARRSFGSAKLPNPIPKGVYWFGRNSSSLLLQKVCDLEEGFWFDDLPSGFGPNPIVLPTRDFSHDFLYSLREEDSVVFSTGSTILHTRFCEQNTFYRNNADLTYLFSALKSQCEYFVRSYCKRHTGCSIQYIKPYQLAGLRCKPKKLDVRQHPTLFSLWLIPKTCRICLFWAVDCMLKNLYMEIPHSLSQTLFWEGVWSMWVSLVLQLIRFVKVHVDDRNGPILTHTPETQYITGICRVQKKYPTGGLTDKGRWVGWSKGLTRNRWGRNVPILGLRKRPDTTRIGSSSGSISSSGCGSESVREGPEGFGSSSDTP